MKIKNIQGSMACSVSTLKINKQKGFKGKEALPSSKDKENTMTKEQKTWLGVGLTAIGAVLIGIIVWVCSKNKKKPSKIIEETIKTPEPKSLPCDKNGFALMPLSKVRTYKKPDLPLTKMIENGGTSHIKFSKNVNDLNRTLKMEQPLLYKDNPNWENVKKMPQNFSNFELNEVMTIVPYSIGKFHNDRITPIKQQRYYSEKDSRSIFKKYRECYQFSREIESKKDEIFAKVDEQALKNRKQFFVNYIKERSKYIDNNNQLDILRQNLLKNENPSEDVIDAELLRMDVITNQAASFLYSEDGLEQNLNTREKLESIIYLIDSYFSSKMLEEFKPQKAEKDLSENEKNYFKEINKYGAEQSKELKEQIIEKVNSCRDYVTGVKNIPEKYKENYDSFKDNRNLVFLNYWQVNKNGFSPKEKIDNHFYSKINLLDVMSNNMQEKYYDKFYDAKTKDNVEEDERSLFSKNKKKDRIFSIMNDLEYLNLRLIRLVIKDKNMDNEEKYEKEKEKIKNNINENKKQLQKNLSYILDDTINNNIN